MAVVMVVTLALVGLITLLEEVLAKVLIVLLHNKISATEL